MKICITRSQRHAYSETFIQRQIQGLSRRFEVLTLHSGRMPAREENGRLIHNPVYWGLHTILKLFTGNRNDWFSNYGMQQFLEQNKVELVLSNYGISAVHMLPICKKLNLPLIPHFHGYDATQHKVLKQYGAQYVKLFEYVPAIIAVSDVMKNKLIELGAPAEKVKTIPYGINLEQFAPKQEAKTAYPLLLAVGRFIPKKAPQITIRAFSQVLLEFPDAKLMMVGGREGEYEKCVQLVNELGIGKSVIFQGVAPPEQITQYMQQAHLFVQHSITAPSGDMEGTPVSILEAAASGLPVVSTRHGGILDAIVEGHSGFLVDELDENGMAQKMLEILRNPQLRELMGAAARKHIEANYSMEHQMDKLQQLLSSCIK